MAPSTFHYTPYEPANVGTIAQLMGLPAQLQAQAARNIAEAQARANAAKIQASGQMASAISGGVNQTIGNLGQILQLKKEAPIRALQLQDLQNRVNAEAQGPLNAQKAQAAHAKLSKLVQDNTSNKVIDHKSVIAGMEADPDLEPMVGEYVKQAIATHELLNPKVETPKTREVVTPDPNDPTRRVTRIVEDKPDQSFPVPPPEAPKVTYSQPQIQIVGGKKALVRAGSDGKIYDLNMKAIPSDQIAPYEKPTEQTGNAAFDASNAKEVASGIKDGTISPALLESTRATSQGLALSAELHRQGVDSDKLLRDWIGTKKAIGSLNSASQLRLAEVINKASESLNKLDELNQEWSNNATRWGIKTLNKASLKAAQNGLYGKDAASVAQRLDGQIADVTSELGQAVMGGNSPTDHALDLASKNLGSDWDQNVLADSIKQVRYNLNLAQNARNEILGGLGNTSTQIQTPSEAAPAAPSGWKYVPKQGGGWTAVPADK